MRCICAVGKNNRDTRQGGIGDKGSKSGVGGGRGVGTGGSSQYHPPRGDPLYRTLYWAQDPVYEIWQPTVAAVHGALGERAIQVSSSWSCRQSVRIWVQTIVRKIFVYVRCLWNSCNCVLGVLYCPHLYTCPRCIHVLYCPQGALRGLSDTLAAALSLQTRYGEVLFFQCSPFQIVSGDSL